jgi:hypothetical protein
MNPGTSSNYIADQVAANNSRDKVSRDQLNQFLEDVTHAIQDLNNCGEDGLPAIETDKEVVDFYTDRPSFEAGTLSFIFQGVKVYERGRKDQAIERAKSPVPDASLRLITNGPVQPRKRRTR